MPAFVQFPKPITTSGQRRKKIHQCYILSVCFFFSIHSIWQLWHPWASSFMITSIFVMPSTALVEEQHRIPDAFERVEQIPLIILFSDVIDKRPFAIWRYVANNIFRGTRRYVMVRAAFKNPSASEMPMKWARINIKCSTALSLRLHCECVLDIFQKKEPSWWLIVYKETTKWLWENHTLSPLSWAHLPRQDFFHFIK